MTNYYAAKIAAIAAWPALTWEISTDQEHNDKPVALIAAFESLPGPDVDITLTYNDEEHRWEALLAYGVRVGGAHAEEPGKYDEPCEDIPAIVRAVKKCLVAYAVQLINWAV